MNYTYYESEGAIFRDNDPVLHVLEVYRGGGQWAPFATPDDFVTYDQITPEESQQLVLRQDQMSRQRA